MLETISGLAWPTNFPLSAARAAVCELSNESWNPSRNQLILELSGVAGKQYELAVWNPSQIVAVKGGVVTKAGKLQVQMPDGPEGTYVPQKVVLSFQKH